MKPSTLALLSLIAIAGPAAAQDLTYVQTTRVEFGGSLGAMMNMVPGGIDPTRETVYLKGSLQRRDTEASSTIMDWATGSMIMIDHETRTFVRLDMEDMAAALAEGMAEGMEGAPGRGEGVEAEHEEDEEAPTFTAHFDVERTGRDEDVAGYRAEQAVMTLEVEGEVPPEDVEEGGLNEAGMAVVSELWLSTDFPEWAALQEARAAMAERMGASAMADDMRQSLGGMAAMDPRINVALEENRQALSEMEGTALKTIVNLVSVPTDVELDVDAVLDKADEDLASGMGGIALEGAASAARSALGSLGSRFGRGKKKEEPKQPAAAQSIFMRITTEVGDVDAGEVDDSMFLPPEGYTERTGGIGR